jgi:signal transduction histidine kinase
VLSAPLLELIADLPSAERRSASAEALARALGAEELLILLRHSDADPFEPAPGFCTGLTKTADWQAFLERCISDGTARGDVVCPAASGAIARRVLGFASGKNAALVLIGGEPQADSAADLARLLPLLASALAPERAAGKSGQLAARVEELEGRARVLESTVQAAQNTIRRALAEAESANLAKDQFVAALSHDLRAPLNPVLMAAEAMASDADFRRTSATRPRSSGATRNSRRG